MPIVKSNVVDAPGTVFELGRYCWAIACLDADEDVAIRLRAWREASSPHMCIKRTPRKKYHRKSKYWLIDKTGDQVEYRPNRLETIQTTWEVC